LNSYGAMVNTYTANDVKTSNRLKLLIMLFDGAVKFMNIAMQKMEENDTAGKGLFIGKAMAIIAEFKGTLDYRPNPELAESLERLYTFINDSLLKANIKNDKNHLANALRITNTLREGWVELQQKIQSGGDTNLERAARGQTANSSVRISV
jgi:flagellar secretion chaperone FliS